MWSLSAWRRQRLLAKHPIADDTWQRVRHHLTFLDGLTAEQERKTPGVIEDLSRGKQLCQQRCGQGHASRTAGLFRQR